MKIGERVWIKSKDTSGRLLGEDGNNCIIAIENSESVIVSCLKEDLSRLSNTSYLNILRDILRYSSNYTCMLDLFSLYSLYRIEVLKNNKIVFSDHGETLEKRLKKAISFILEDLYKKHI